LAITDYLRECGYKVYEAVNAQEAIAMLQSPELVVDIVFSDVQMPGDMDGFALSRWIRANKPGVQVILTSGVERSPTLRQPRVWRDLCLRSHILHRM
jgi:CheY-like chemotaxis protein